MTCLFCMPVLIIRARKCAMNMPCLSPRTLARPVSGAPRIHIYIWHNQANVQQLGRPSRKRRKICYKNPSNAAHRGSSCVSKSSYAALKMSCCNRMNLSCWDDNILNGSSDSIRWQVLPMALSISASGSDPHSSSLRNMLTRISFCGCVH